MSTIMVDGVSTNSCWNAEIGRSMSAIMVDGVSPNPCQKVEICRFMSTIIVDEVSTNPCLFVVVGCCILFGQAYVTIVCSDMVQIFAS